MFPSKLMVLSASALFVISLTACGDQTPKATDVKVKPVYESPSSAPASVQVAQAQAPAKPASAPAAKPAPAPSAAKASGAPSASAKADSASKNSNPTATEGLNSRGTLDSVANYATGATALTVKKNVTTKLKNIQGKHNDALDKELNN